jgi:DNA invertase Pin-like site-specific DNA recombinase|tara:strand:- start:2757 stop:3425 length:669 start_codon:yes stop_codon:yes gene_type:complete
MQAVAYLRTSSLTNVGEDKDSAKRQLEAIKSHAKRAKISLVLPPFYDVAVSGSDPIDTREGFRLMLATIRGNPDIKAIIVETASRFARDLIVQETGHNLLKEMGVQLIATDSPDSFLDDTPTAQLIRQVLGAVSQFDKANTVAKLRVARERKKAAQGKCEGRKSILETYPEATALARKLNRKPRGGKRPALVQIAKELAKSGHLNSKGKPFHHSQIKRMISF